MSALTTFNSLVELTIKMNRRDNGLYHSYNTVKISDSGMEIVYLQEMLEGQVAVLSSDLLTPDEAQAVVEALEKSRMYETRQHSYMLYPNKELPAFQNKNCVKESEVADLKNLIKRTGTLYMEKDVNGIYHFNPDFRNSNVIKDFIAAQKEENRPTDAEQEELLEVYEKTFNHQSFTGRSGTFYAYEGLGSIYWHMVSKLLLAVQENIFKAQKPYSQNYYQAAMKMHISVKSVLCIGDQLFTDIYGGNLAGIYTILVNPINRREEIQIVLKRFLERIVLHFYKKKLKSENKTWPKRKFGG